MRVPEWLELFCDFLSEEEIESETKTNREQLKIESERTLHERLCDSNRQIFLFEKGRSIVGFAEVLLEEKCFPDEDLPEMCVKILAFYIKPQERGQKLGTSFFKLIRDWGRDQKASLVEVDVPSHPLGANEFLLHQGLELVGAGVRNGYRAFI